MWGHGKVLDRTIVLLRDEMANGVPTPAANLTPSELQCRTPKKDGSS